MKMKGIRLWSLEENHKLLRLKCDTKEKWSKISENFPGRTAISVREHYKKITEPVPYLPWSIDEDHLLLELFSQLNSKDKWFISTIFNYRDLTQVFYRWNYFRKQVEDWSKSEIYSYKNAVKLYGKDMKLISEHVRTKDEIQCRYKYNFIKLDLYVYYYNAWDKEKQIKLEGLFNTYLTDHEYIAKFFDNVTTKTIVDKWSRYKTKYLKGVIEWTKDEEDKMINISNESDLNEIAKLLNRPKLDCYLKYKKLRYHWSDLEEMTLIELIGDHKLKWKDVCHHFPYKDKAQFYLKMARLLKKDNLEGSDEFNNNEIEKFEQGRILYGLDFTHISQFMETKSPRQCYVFYLMNSVNLLTDDDSTRHWNDFEDLKLLKLVGFRGLQWELISKEMGTRSARQCKIRWFSFYCVNRT